MIAAEEGIIEGVRRLREETLQDLVDATRGGPLQVCFPSFLKCSSLSDAMLSLCAVTAGMALPGHGQ